MEGVEEQHTLSCVLVCVRLSVFQASSAPDDQFNAFVAIRDQFLLSTSPEEVNISSVMNKQLMSFTTRCSTGHEAVAKAGGFGPKQVVVACGKSSSTACWTDRS